MSIYKSAPGHNPLFAPAVCLCVECCRIVAALRCPVRHAKGAQCGDYTGHRSEHSLIVATVFSICEDRLAPNAIASGGERSLPTDRVPFRKGPPS